MSGMRLMVGQLVFWWRWDIEGLVRIMWVRMMMKLGLGEPGILSGGVRVMVGILGLGGI